MPVSRSFGTRTHFWLSLPFTFGIAVLSVGCAEPAPAQAPAPAVPVAARDLPQYDPARIVTFAVSPQNLNVDKISMREGSPMPDGNRDLVFTATVEGPIDALYLVTCTSKGEPLHNFHADTVIGREELPAELGSVVDVGSMTEWIAITENGKFLNHENGKIEISRGSHALTMYVPNTGMLRGGTFLRLYGRMPDGTLVAGPVVPY